MHPILALAATVGTLCVAVTIVGIAVSLGFWGVIALIVVSAWAIAVTS